MRPRMHQPRNSLRPHLGVLGDSILFRLHRWADASLPPVIFSFHLAQLARTSALGSKYIASSIGMSYSSSRRSLKYRPSVSVASSRTSSDSWERYLTIASRATRV